MIAGMVALSVLWSCSTRKLMVTEMTDLMETGAGAFETDDDLYMLQQALPAHIKLLEALLASDPQNERLLILLARLYGSYSFLFIDGRLERFQLTGSPPAAGEETPAELKDKALRYYGRGVEYALAALQIRHPRATESLYQVTSSASFVQSLQRPDLAALFWYGFNLSGLVNHSRDSVAAIARAHLIEKAMQRVIELQPDFYHGSAHLVLMIYYASRSPMMGGNLARAQGHYDQLKNLNGDKLLLTDLFYARTVVVQQQNRRLFEETLTAVAGSADTDARFRLFNRVARDRALVYLSAADRLFEDS